MTTSERRSRRESSTGRGGAGGRFPNTRETRDSLARFHQALYGLNAAERRLNWRYRQAREPLSYGRYRALLALMVEGEMTPSQLARDTEVNPATITLMLDELTEQGVVTRRRDEHDGRVSWVSLTKRGRSEVSALEVEWGRRFSIAFRNFSDDELEIASRVLEKATSMFETVARKEDEMAAESTGKRRSGLRATK